MQLDNELRNDLSYPKKPPVEFGLTKKELSRALDNMVKVSVDVFVYDSKGRILLGSRKHLPLKGLWCFGGRMLPRELFSDAAIRNIKRELGIVLDEDDVSFVGFYSMVWDKRAEEPVENGFHDLMIFMKTKIDLNVHRINLDGTHSSVEWYTPAELRELDKQGKIHPYLMRGLIDSGLINT